MADLRIALDTGPLHGPLTGVGLYVEALRRELRAMGDIELTEYVLSFRATLQPGTRRLPLPASWAHRIWSHTPHPRVDRWLGGAQLVHGTNFVVPPTRLPTVITLHDCWFLRHPDQVTTAVRRSGSVLRAGVRRGAVLVTPSESTARQARELFPGTAVQAVHLGPLPLGPDTGARPDVPGLDGRPYVLALGTLERRKNLPRLVQAFGRVATMLPDVALVLAGSEGDDAPAVRAAIESLGPSLADRVHLTGRVDEPLRSQLLRHATALAYPSFDEGFGFPLLDAMQAGVPLVAAATGSIPEIAGDAALLVDPTDTDALANALVVAITDEATRRRLVGLGELQWQRFSWQRCAAETAALYRRVVAGDVDDLR